MDSFDLLSCDLAYHVDRLIGWYPRQKFTRAQAQSRFQRDLQNATWPTDWRTIRVVARYLRQDPSDPEGYIECQPQAPGATPVWRCEIAPTIGLITSGIVGYAQQSW